MNDADKVMEVKLFIFSEKAFTLVTSSRSFANCLSFLSAHGKQVWCVAKDSIRGLRPLKRKKKAAAATRCIGLCQQRRLLYNDHRDKAQQS